MSATAYEPGSPDSVPHLHRRYSRRCGVGVESGQAGVARLTEARSCDACELERAPACATVKRDGTARLREGRFRFLGYGACALAGTLWGTGFYFGRLALNEMSVEQMVLYRFLFACLGMLPVMLTQRVRLTAGEMRTLLLAAFFGIPIQFLLQFHGLALTTVSHASLMVGAMPVLLAAGCGAVCRRAAGLDRLAGTLRVDGGRGDGGAWREPRRPRGAKRPRSPATCW